MATFRGSLLLFLVLQASTLFSPTYLSSCSSPIQSSGSDYSPRQKSHKITPVSKYPFSSAASFSPRSGSSKSYTSESKNGSVGVGGSGNSDMLSVSSKNTNNNSIYVSTAKLYCDIVTSLNVSLIPSSIQSEGSKEALSVVLKHFDLFKKHYDSGSLTETLEKGLSREFIRDIVTFSYEMLVVASFLVLILNFPSLTPLIAYRVVTKRINKDFSTSPLTKDLPFYHFKFIFHDSIQINHFTPFLKISDPNSVNVMFSVISKYYESLQSHHDLKFNKISYIVDAILRNGHFSHLDNFLPDTDTNEKKFTLFPVAFHNVLYNCSLNSHNTEGSVLSTFLNKILDAETKTKVTDSDINSLAVTASHFDDFISFNTIFKHSTPPNILQILPFVSVSNPQIRAFITSCLLPFDQVTLDMKLIRSNSPDPRKIIDLFCSQKSCSLSHIIAKLMYQGQFSFIVNDLFSFNETIDAEEIVKEFVAINGIEVMKSEAFNLENWILQCSQSYHFSELPNHILPLVFDKEEDRQNQNQLVISALGNIHGITNEASYATALNLLSYSTGELADLVSQAINCESKNIPIFGILFALEVDKGLLLSFNETIGRSVSLNTVGECLVMQIFRDPHTRFDILLY